MGVCLRIAPGSGHPCPYLAGAPTPPITDQRIVDVVRQPRVTLGCLGALHPAGGHPGSCTARRPRGHAAAGNRGRRLVKCSPNSVTTCLARGRSYKAFSSSPEIGANAKGRGLEAAGATVTTRQPRTVRPVKPTSCSVEPRRLSTPHHRLSRCRASSRQGSRPARGCPPQRRFCSTGGRTREHGRRSFAPCASAGLRRPGGQAWGHPV